MFPLQGVKFRKRIQAGSAEAYVFATVCVVTAAILRWVFGLFFEGVVPFATFFPAALFAALVGGIGPGTFAAISGCMIGWWAFLDPPMTFFPLTSGQRLSLIAYLFTSLLIVWAADHYRKLTKRLEDEEKFRQLAVQELAHRLKNKVATIQSIVTLRLREHRDVRDEILACFESLKATDDLIIATQGKGARLGDIVSAELRPYDAMRVSTKGPDILLPPKLALTMALLLHELATNAAKYGALSSSSGKIAVEWFHCDGKLNLKWQEGDGPAVTTPSHRGFGTRLFLQALAQFGGKVDATFARSGLVCTLSVPVSETVATTAISASGMPTFQPVE